MLVVRDRGCTSVLEDPTLPDGLNQNSRECTASDDAKNKYKNKMKLQLNWTGLKSLSNLLLFYCIFAHLKSFFST